MAHDMTSPPAGSITDGRSFGTVDGRAVSLFTLRNDAGMEVDIISWGGIVTRLSAPDSNGQFADVVLGYDNIEDYVAHSPYFGALIGPYGNRIGGGRFTLDGESFGLPQNDGVNTLHGGPAGFHMSHWDARRVTSDDGRALVLTLERADGDSGFPGTLKVSVTYTLTEANELRIDYAAETDRATPVALTHHSYFNLSGDLSRAVTDHLISIRASHYTPVDETLIPTGEIASVAGTPFDFRTARPIGDRIDDDNEQLRYGGGYDHNFVLDRDRPGLVPAATVTDPVSGRRMEVLTTEPGLQFYTGNSLDETYRGKGTVFGRRSGFCLETQHFPDSPNKPDFPSTILRPGEHLASTTIYRFCTI